MKKVLVGFAALAVLAAAAMPLAAQTEALKANVPFPFMVGTRAVAAGEYTITEDSNAPVVVVRDAGETGAVAIVTKGAVEQASDTHLVFNRYGDRYFLAKIVDAANGVVMVLPRTATEREFAKTASVEHTSVTAVWARR